MLPCKDIVRILSSNEKLSLMTKVELEMHILICKHCSRYAEHLRLMKNGFKKLFSKITHVEEQRITELEDGIIKTLKDK